MAHHIAPNGDIYADTKFLNSIGGLPGVEVKHLGFGEFVVETPKGEVEFDRMRGKDFPGQSGRSHLIYDHRGGDTATKWLIAEAEEHGKSQRVASSLRERVIRLASQNERLRPHLLPILKGQS